jgi:hypothetical protein
LAILPETAILLADYTRFSTTNEPIPMPVLKSLDLDFIQDDRRRVFLEKPDGILPKPVLRSGFSRETNMWVRENLSFKSVVFPDCRGPDFVTFWP